MFYEVMVKNESVPWLLGKFRVRFLPGSVPSTVLNPSIHNLVLRVSVFKDTSFNVHCGFINIDVTAKSI